jgi:hypothetical protein
VSYLIEVYHTEDKYSYTEGFEVSEDGLEITIGSGTLKFIEDDSASAPLYDLEGHKTGLEQVDQKRINSIEYPQISYIVEPHEEKVVQYDIYLLDINGKPAYHMDRTLQSGIVQADYSGDGKPLHHLMTMVIPPLANSLEDIPVHVNLLKLKDKDNPPL